MFKLLRSNAKPFYWFIAIAFILSMAIMGLMSNGRPLFGSSDDDSQGSVLKVADGIEISAQEWSMYSRNHINTQLNQMGGRIPPRTSSSN